jgi:alanine racemase
MQTWRDYKRAVKNVLQVCSKNIEVEGIYTHFANAEARSKSLLTNSWEDFDLLTSLKREGLSSDYSRCKQRQFLISKNHILIWYG